MNKIYRIVFNAVTGRWVVASELATGRKKQGGGERIAVAAVLVTGVMGSLMGAAHAGVVVNGDPQEASANCELITDSGTTSWTASTSAGACLAPVLAGSASGQGNPGADAIFYASNATNGAEDSLNLGGYLDVFKTATFHGGIAMDGQKITGLANGTVATDAATFGQLTNAMRYFKVLSAAADASATGSDAIAIGGNSVASGANGTSVGMGATTTATDAVAIGSRTTSAGVNSTVLGNQVTVDADNSIAIQGNSVVNVAADAASKHAIAIGTMSTVSTSASGIAIGELSTVTGANKGVALGANASATAANSVALGAGSTTTATLGAAAYNPGSAALSGTASAANGEVSIGKTGSERRLTNLAAGSAATDAVNVSQLQAQDATVDKQGADMAAALGGGSTYNAATGAISAPSYTLSNANTIGGTAGAATDVGAGFAKVDTALGKLNTSVTNINTGAGIKYFHVNSAASDSTAAAVDSTAIGPLANVTAGAVNGIAIGRAATVTDNATASGIAIGSGAVADATQAIALGRTATAAADDAFAVGYGSKVAAGAINSVAIGRGANVTSNVTTSGFAIGTGAVVDASDSMAFGRDSRVSGTDSVSIGHSSTVTSTDSLAIGHNSNVAAADSLAVGYGAKVAAGAINSIAIGRGATVTANAATSGFAIGTGATADATDSVSFGRDSKAIANDSLALGHGSLADRAMTVSVGKAGSERQVVNMAKGTADTDAVNVSQLKGVTTALGGGAAVNADGTIKAPSYALANANALGGTSGAAADVGAGFAKVDAALGAVSATANKGFNISADAGATSQNIAPGGTVKFNAGTNATVSRSGDTVTYSVVSNPTFSGMLTANGGLVVGAGKTIDMGGNKVTNVADGTIASGSKEAVNGGQLYTTNQTVAALDGRVTTAEGNITSLQTTVNNINGGKAGLVQQSAAGANLTVGKATDGAAVDFAGTAGARKLLNVADGTVAANSKDAVNGGQLYTTNQTVTALDGRVTTAEGNISTLTTNVAGNTSSISSLQTTVNNISNGTVGLVQQSAAGANLTVGKTKDGAAVDFAGTAGARKLLNVADGTIASASKDAVNGGQLYTTNQNVAQNTSDISALGGRVTTAEGNITNLTTRVTTSEGNISTLNTKVNNIDGRVTQNTTDIAGNTTSINNLQNSINNISSGSVGLVQQSAAGANLTVGKGTDGAAVDFAGTAGARKLVNIADGTVAANSKDAVNGGQLDATNQVVAANTSAINTLDGRVTTNEGDISSLDTRVTTNEGDISTLKTDVTNIDGRVTTNEGDISTLKTDVTNIDGRMTTAEGNISTLTTNVSNIDGRVSNVEGSVTNITNQLSNGEIGLVQQDATSRVITVAKDSDGATVDLAGTAGARKLVNVADGTVAANSKDAVNGGQLDATNQVVAANTSAINTLDGRVTTNEGDISTLKTDVTNIDGRVTTNEGDISTLKTDVTNIDGRVTTAEGNITSLDNRVTKNEGDISTLNTNVSNIDGRVTNVEGSVTNITNQLNSGEIGLVQYDDAAGVVSVAKDKAGTAVDFRGTAGARRLKGVAAGGEDEDAVNVSQLKKVTDAMGGGASVNADGSITAPTYYVTNADGSKSSVTNMGDAMSNIDSRVYNNTTSITTINQQISSGTIGMVQQASAGAKLTVGKDTDGAEVDFANNAGNARKLTSVADGAVAAGSKDAVNGGQLHAVSQSMASALGGGSTVNADGTVTAPSYSVTNADGSTSQVNGVEGAISNIDNRTYQNTQAITHNTSAINNLTTQISNGEVGLVKQDAATRQITVAKDSDGAAVSVAGTAGDRVVTGVASAKADNDAVNLGQLKAAGLVSANGETKSIVTYDTADKSSMTMGGEGATSAVTIHNVADGVADHDAVNVSQLNTRLQQNSTEVLVQANSYTDQKLGDVWTGMDKLANEVAKQDGRISQHGAMSMAEAQMASGAAAAAVGNPNGAWSVGLGSEQGHGAISAGYAKPVGKNSQISFGAAFGGSDHSVGVGFAHRL